MKVLKCNGSGIKEIERRLGRGKKVERYIEQVNQGNQLKQSRNQAVNALRPVEKDCFVTNPVQNIRKNRFVPTQEEARQWRIANGIPEYVNASYSGYTGAKAKDFPTVARASAPDITKDLNDFETEILQDIKDTRKKPFGYIKSIRKFLKNFGTGEAWDTKFRSQFPGRDKLGRKQYAVYNGEIVTANDISNIIYGHLCTYMGIPVDVQLLIARLDANGALELFTKGKLPSKELMHFKDTPSDQAIIRKAGKKFNINNYKLR